ncbi:hypothetical protein D9613_000331 [Agrocybe pediades]|uniref:Uncharacterized protein n=1 Tax=Agrocybe pediades TaxID=84607 RepID=A0A8H4R0S1_9AGAR|nr:hypothetical protein D9613_000331 [Agrocybe pediades]
MPSIPYVDKKMIIIIMISCSASPRHRRGLMHDIDDQASASRSRFFLNWICLNRIAHVKNSGHWMTGNFDQCPKTYPSHSNEKTYEMHGAPVQNSTQNAVVHTIADSSESARAALHQAQREVEIHESPRRRRNLTGTGNIFEQGMPDNLNTETSNRLSPTTAGTATISTIVVLENARQAKEGSPKTLLFDAHVYMDIFDIDSTANSEGEDSGKDSGKDTTPPEKPGTLGLPPAFQHT